MSFYAALKNGSWLKLRRIIVYPRIILVMYVLLGIAWPFGLYQHVKPGGALITTDYINVYAAGLTAHEHHAASAYDGNEHHDRQDRITLALNEGNKSELKGDYIPWLYPPMFFFVAWCAAWLPYFISLIFYEGASLVAYLAALRKLAPSQHPPTKWIIAAFPGMFVNMFAGQNGFITTALLGFGLALLEQSPVIAGTLFGALSYKPHFFALIPLALIFGRYWKALIASLISAGTCAGLSLMAFGIQAWQSFFQSLPGTRVAMLENDGSDCWLGKIHSVFSLVRIFGGSTHLAYIIQFAASSAAIAVLIWIWSRPSSSLAVRGSALVAASFLASPYSFVYDQALLAVPIALLAREGLHKGFLSFEKTFLAVLWLLPFVIKDVGKDFAFPLTPPLLTCLMILCWRRARAESSGGTGTQAPDLLFPEQFSKASYLQ